jgi:hypothetical protein
MSNHRQEVTGNIQKAVKNCIKRFKLKPSERLRSVQDDKVNVPVCPLINISEVANLWMLFYLFVDTVYHFSPLFLL